MSGAVNAGKSIVNTAWDVARAPAESVRTGAGSLLKGEGVGKALGKGAKRFVQPTLDLGMDAMGGVMGSPDELPNIAVEDPVAVEERNKKERARVKRQAEIDLMTDKPGRGGTILTDKYTYNV